MEKEILSRVENINVYGIVSISIFFLFFTGMLIWAFAKKKNYLDKMSSLPLDGGETNSTDKIQS
jgi:cytochrome c oxidase cbb3-type subunit 4